MKELLIATLLTLSTAASANCVIKVQVKKPKAKTYYLHDGTTISKKVREALKEQCKFDVSVMSVDDQEALLRAQFEKRLKKLRKK